jgi:hypothetical protein
MDEDAPPPPRPSHSNGTSQHIEPYPRGVYHDAGGYGSYAPSYSYYSHQHHHQHHQHGQHHQHPRAAPPAPNVVSRAYLDATGASAAGYLNHHWAAQQPFDVAAGSSAAPPHHAQSPRSPVPLAPAPALGRSGGGPAAGSGSTGTRRRSSVSLVPPPLSSCYTL